MAVIDKGKWAHMARSPIVAVSRSHGGTIGSGSGSGSGYGWVSGSANMPSMRAMSAVARVSSARWLHIVPSWAAAMAAMVDTISAVMTGYPHPG